MITPSSISHITSLQSELDQMSPAIRQSAILLMSGKEDLVSKDMAAMLSSWKPFIQLKEKFDTLDSETQNQLLSHYQDVQNTFDNSQQYLGSENNSVFDSLFEKIPSELRTVFKEHLTKAINYTPKIGIMGKSGAGKSSLANAIVGKKVFETGAVGGCTRAFQEEIFEISPKRKLIFMDLPGIGENLERKNEYENLYKQKIQELDIILWTIKVDDRSNQIDQEFYQWLIKNYNKNQILFVLTQADKAEPSPSWKFAEYRPSEKQMNVIIANQQRISTDFSVPLDDVIPVSCYFDDEQNCFKYYNFEKLITHIIHKVPAKAKSSVYATVEKENVTNEAKQEAQSGFEKTASEIFDFVIDVAPLPSPVKKIAVAAKDVVIKGAKKLWNSIFG